MHGAGLLVWIGRAAFLGMFYYFLYLVYRSLLMNYSSKETAGTKTVTKIRARLTLVFPDRGKPAVWLEDLPNEPRNITKEIPIIFDESLTFGRAEDNQLRTDDPYVSKYHFVVRKNGKYFELEDLDTTNGTYIDGMKITGTTHLNNGSHIVAGALRFRFEVT